MDRLARIKVNLEMDLRNELDRIGLVQGLELLTFSSFPTIYLRYL